MAMCEAMRLFLVSCRWLFKAGSMHIELKESFAKLSCIDSFNTDGFSGNFIKYVFHF